MTYKQIKTELEKFTDKNYKTETDKDGKEYFLVPSKLYFYAHGTEFSITRESPCAFDLSRFDKTISYIVDGQERLLKGILLMSDIYETQIVYDKIYKQVIEGSNSTIREV